MTNVVATFIPSSVTATIRVIVSIASLFTAFLVVQRVVKNNKR